MKEDIIHYLTKRGITFFESREEITARCIFNKCDENSHGREAHLYISSQTGQYHCKKCGATGNMITLAKHFGDDPVYEGFVEKSEKEERISGKDSPNIKISVSEKDVEKYHKNLPNEIRTYLHERGITDDTIAREKLGWGSFYHANWITIPVRDIDGKFLFFKLRRDPKQTEGNKYMCYPSGGTGWGLYGAKWLKDNTDYIVICEGEFDQMMLEQASIIAITSTAGATTFKDEWITKLEAIPEIYICLDNDEVGKKAMANLAEKLRTYYPLKKIATVDFPFDFEGKDITDFMFAGGDFGELLTKSTSVDTYDTSTFQKMGVQDIIDVLSLTIKRDDTNKVLVFLTMLSAYTEDSQLNVLLNAPSASWKTYIPLQIVQLFPQESIMEIAHSSRTAFFHEDGEYDKETNTRHIHLERKIIIFLDQPSSDLLGRLRPILSHDKKELTMKTTDKNKQGGNTTKTVIVHGYPVAVFCTASLSLDEQESTRFLLVSPETDEEKIRDAISEKFRYETNHEQYIIETENNPKRKVLKERLRAIKDLHIQDIKLHDTKRMEAIFLKTKTRLKPRHQRDSGKFLTLVKMMALLNFPHRKMENNNLLTNDFDITEAEKLWRQIEDTTEYGISPYIMRLYDDIVLPAYRGYNTRMCIGDEMIGVSRKEILTYHLKRYGRPLPDVKWRQEIEPMLESAWLITTEHDSNDKRIILITPLEERNIKKI